MIKIIEAPLEQDLKPLSVFWHQQKIRHRISEEQGKQIVYAVDNSVTTKMLDDYSHFCDGQLAIRLEKKATASTIDVQYLRFFRRYPVTLLFIGISIVGFLSVQLGFDSLVDLLVIQSTDQSRLPFILDVPSQISIREYLTHGHYWRLLTPIFLHFGWLHIIFNMLWLWELGKRIEIQGGSLHLLTVVLVVGIASNLYQAEATPMAFFGGMSGVIYGLLGYCAVFNVISPSQRLQLPMAIYLLMLASLFIGYLGVFDFLARMANTAHLSGLVLGIIMGLFSSLIYRFVPARNT